MESRTSSTMITELKDYEIFVFGSNLSGRHGRGAAKQAMKWGAIYGRGNGLQGRTYAIPTKNYKLQTLAIEQIKMFVDTFINFAKTNPQLIFLVTEIGTGLANHKKENIAPLFKDAINIQNIHLPFSFWNILNSITKSKLKTTCPICGSTHYIREGEYYQCTECMKMF